MSFSRKKAQKHKTQKKNFVHFVLFCGEPDLKIER